MVKKAPVHILEAGPIMPGKYLVQIGGGVDEVDEAFRAGRQAAGDTLVDQLMLPYPHHTLRDLLTAPASPTIGALGIIEGFSITGIVRAADAALKAAYIQGVRLDRSVHLGGKATFTFTGALHDVEAAMEASRSALGEGLLAGSEIIANPHGDVRP
jgi:microcompartment protein CcmL/EutN